MPHTGGFGQHDPKRRSSQLLAVPGFCEFDSREGLASSNQSLEGGAIAASLYAEVERVNIANTQQSQRF